MPLKPWMGLASVAVAVVAGTAVAQTPLRDLRAQNAAAHEAQAARQDLLASQREITARQDQASTALTLRELDSARLSPPGADLLALRPATVIQPDAAGASFTAQMDRMERLTQDALARGNARIRAIRPASQQ